MKYPNIFSPMKIGNCEIKNRIIMGPTGFGQAAPDGEFSKAAEDFYALRAKGDVGLIVTGIAEPDFEIETFPGGGVSFYVNPNQNPRVFVERCTELTERVHSYGGKIFIQITAGLGRSFHNVSCSENPLWGDPSTNAHVITKEEIKRKIELIVSATEISKAAGFDGVDISAMHEGMLLDEMASTFANKRTDEYGGPLENRMRMATEIVEAIKATCGSDYPVIIRLSARGFTKGWNSPSLHGDGEVWRTVDESIEIAKYLEKVGYDAIVVDAGTFDSMYHLYQPMYIPRGINFEYTEILKQHVNIPIIATGRMDIPKMVEDNLAEGNADAVVIGRGLLADADLVAKAKLGQEEKIRPCLTCNIGCLHRILSGQRFSCAVNPQAMRETTYKLTPALTKKKILIVGGGIAGMEAARAAKLRGHQVILAEKSGNLGGHLLPGGVPWFKDAESKLVKWYVRELKELEVEIHLNTEASADYVRSLGVDSVIIATGSTPIKPKKFEDCDLVISCTDALLGKKEVGNEVLIIGGGLVGCEMALHFNKQGKNVTIVERLNNILSSGKPVPFMNKMMLEDLITDRKINVLTNHDLESIENDVAFVTDNNGNKTEVKVDTIISAVGFKSENKLYNQLSSEFETYTIGDSRDVTNIKNAIWDGYEIGRSI